MIFRYFVVDFELCARVCVCVETEIFNINSKDKREPGAASGKGAGRIDRAELQVIMPLHLMAATLKFAYRIWQMLQKYSAPGVGGSCTRGNTLGRHKSRRDVK